MLLLSDYRAQSRRDKKVLLFAQPNENLKMTQAELIYQHLKQLPESMVSEVFDFVKFLEHKHPDAKNQAPRQPGSAKGLIWIADDFDAPLDDFKDYQ